MEFRSLFPVVLLAVLGLSAAQGETLYKWIDKDGRVSYHDQPPTNASYRVEKKNIGRNDQAKGDESLAKVVEKYPVVLYSATDCSSCELARAYLKKRNVPFTEHNFDNNPELQQAFQKKVGALLVPTITVGDKVMKGYMQSLLEGELDEVGYPRMPSPDETGDATQDSENSSTADTNNTSTSQ